MVRSRQLCPLAHPTPTHESIARCASRTRKPRAHLSLSMKPRRAPWLLHPQAAHPSCAAALPPPRTLARRVRSTCSRRVAAASARLLLGRAAWRSRSDGSGQPLSGRARVGLPVRIRPYIGRRRPGWPLDFSIGKTMHHRLTHQREVRARPLCARAARLPSQSRMPSAETCRSLRMHRCGRTTGHSRGCQSGAVSQEAAAVDEAAAAAGGSDCPASRTISATPSEAFTPFSLARACPALRAREPRAVRCSMRCITGHGRCVRS